ncbi:MAG: 6-pyruvoyl tetrahydrobiopterin synthase [Ectothiorhodospiraceae bacterium]|nr:6-pyruvoyl tetrahydrobiopterin synthase [Ectothiorhodospiraceae bacterium]
MVYVTRKEHFSAAHRLYNPEWSDEKNQEVFGKCNNPAGHGHNYYVEVTVVGEPDPETGYVVDLKLLKRVIHDEVLSKVDHKNLNEDVSFLRGKIPTAENIAVGIWEQLIGKIPSGSLHSVKLYETEKNIVEYRG